MHPKSLEYQELSTPEKKPFLELSKLDAEHDSASASLLQQPEYASSAYIPWLGKSSI
jgi:hypothetical protein